MFVTIALVAIFFTVVVIAARYGAGSVDSLVNMFGDPSAAKRPHGVQEDDLAPFSFR